MAELDRIRTLVADDVRRIRNVDVHLQVTDRCPALVDRHPLRGFDAIHLATACLVAGDNGDERSGWTFLCADGVLLAAADAEGFAARDPSS